MKKLEQKSASAFFARALCFGAGLSLASCNPLGELTRTDDAYCFGARLADGSCRSSSNNSKTTYTVDQTDDDNSDTGFGGGTHTGTVYQSGVLTLNTTTNNAELDASWTPQWDNLVAYWKMDEPSWNGTANEVRNTKGTNHGIRLGDATTTSSAKLGAYAGTFDGSGDYVLGAKEDSLRNMTSFAISYWVNIGAAGNGGTVVSYNGNSWGAWSSSIAETSLSCAISNGSAWTGYSFATTISKGVWHHVVCLWDGSQLYAFLNGTAVGTPVNASISLHGTDPEDRFRIGRDGWDWGPNYFIGEIDDVAIWNTALSSGEVSLIYSRQSAKYAGEMKSRIIDSKSTDSSWTNLDWITTLPFGKELPDGGGTANSESSAEYSSLSTDTLMNGIIGLWHMNEASWNGTANEVVDSSGNNNHGKRFGSANTSTNGKLKNAGEFDGTNDYVRVPYDASFDITTNITLSAWVKRRDSNYGVIVAQTDGSNFWSFELFFYDGTDSYGDGNYLGFYSDGILPRDISSTTEITDFDWHHVAAVMNGTLVTIYIDGVSTNSVNVTGALPVNNYDLLIGSEGARKYNGFIDEVGIWNRSLSSDEILQIYRRGANRIKYQVRSCTSADCYDQDAATGNGWKGPGGNYLTYFSELFNNNSVSTSCATPQACFASELTLLGDVLTGKPSMLFSNFANDGIVMNNQRYFQYRTILESDDTNTACNGGTSTCMPELKSVTIGPAHTYQQ